MAAIIKSKTESSVTPEITVPLTKPILQCEDNPTETLNQAGCLAAEVALKRFDKDGSAVVLKKWVFPERPAALEGIGPISRQDLRPRPSDTRPISFGPARFAVEALEGAVHRRLCGSVDGMEVSLCGAE